MAFCGNCGKAMSDGDTVCSECGWEVSKVTGNVKRMAVFDGNVHKCPNCGEVLDSFTAKCPTCGFEFRDSQSSSAVKEFSRRLDELEAMRTAPSVKSILARNLGMGKADTTSIKIKNMISTFSVPNTKEDVFEFMILASSNIHYDALAATGLNSLSDLGMNSLEELNEAKEISRAWLAKVEQVYRKARLSFKSDKDFSEIEDIYLQTQEALASSAKKSKKRTRKAIIWLIACLLAMLAIPGGILGGLGISHARTVKKLERTVDEIQLDISNKEYDAALLKASKLYMNSEMASEDEKQHWDEQRESIIELIEELKEADK